MVDYRKLAFFLFVLNFTNAFIKNYNIVIDNVMVCPNSSALAFPIRNLHFIHQNRTHKVLNLDLEFTKPLDKYVGFRSTIEQLTSNGWKRYPFITFLPDICTNLNNKQYFKILWTSFMKQLGVLHPEICPIPPGNYSLRNFDFDTSDFKVPLWSGTYRNTIEYVDARTKDSLLCMIVYCKLIEIV